MTICVRYFNPILYDCPTFSLLEMNLQMYNARLDCFYLHVWSCLEDEDDWTTDAFGYVFALFYIAHLEPSASRWRESRCPSLAYGKRGVVKRRIRERESEFWSTLVALLFSFFFFIGTRYTRYSRYTVSASIHDLNAELSFTFGLHFSSVGPSLLNVWFNFNWNEAGRAE